MYFEEGKNISQIARETGHDRKTIRGYLIKTTGIQNLQKLRKELFILN